MTDRHWCHRTHSAYSLPGGNLDCPCVGYSKGETVVHTHRHGLDADKLPMYSVGWTWQGFLKKNLKVSRLDLLSIPQSGGNMSKRLGGPFVAIWLPVGLSSELSSWCDPLTLYRASLWPRARLAFDKCKADSLCRRSLFRGSCKDNTLNVWNRIICWNTSTNSLLIEDLPRVIWYCTFSFSIQQYSTW